MREIENVSRKNEAFETNIFLKTNLKYLKHWFGQVRFFFQQAAIQTPQFSDGLKPRLKDVR